MSSSTMPSTDFDFSAEAEIAFDDWFHGDYGPFSLRSEYFYGDCKEQDLKTLEKLMSEWTHVAFVTGYERGFAAQNAGGFKPLPDKAKLQIMQSVASSSAIEGEGTVYEIFSKLLYHYLTNQRKPTVFAENPSRVTLHDETI